MVLKAMLEVSKSDNRWLRDGDRLRQLKTKCNNISKTIGSLWNVQMGESFNERLKE